MTTALAVTAVIVLMIGYVVNRVYRWFVPKRSTRRYDMTVAFREMLREGDEDAAIQILDNAAEEYGYELVKIKRGKRRDDDD